MICYSKDCVYYDCSEGIECETADSCIGAAQCARFCGSKPQLKQPIINHPPHYQGDYECIELMRAMFGDQAVIDFCKCNSFKYRFRAGRKDGCEYAEDIAKAEFYEDYMMILHGCME